MKTLEQAQHDVSEVLTCVDYDFDESKRHEETLEAYNRVRPLLATAPDMLKVLEDVAARWDKDDDQDAPELGAAIRAVITKAKQS